ncbi:MAG: biopolymer transporter ExbD [Alphaproteobacteria bacterium]|nr:biopolymer transporter ExbD [Alphaproteobacteria bacterium]
MSLGRRRRSAKPEVDISPLIDVVFILLIFFMVTTTFVKDTQIDLERPGASSGDKASTKALRVVVDRTGALYVGDTPVKPWMLQSRVRDFLRDSSDGAVLVVVDRRVAAEKLIEVVDECRLAGATDVGVVTDAEGG